MTNPLNVEDAQRWVDDWTASISTRAAQARQMADRVGRLTASATSRDGLIEVTVGSSGTITDLRLDDGVRRLPADQISADILSTLKEAQRKLTARVTAVVEETVGAETETGKAIIAGLKHRAEAEGGDRGGR